MMDKAGIRRDDVETWKREALNKGLIYGALAGVLFGGVAGWLLWG